MIFRLVSETSDTASFCKTGTLDDTDSNAEYCPPLPPPPSEITLSVTTTPVITPVVISTGEGDTCDWDGIDESDQVIKLFEPNVAEYIKSRNDWFLVMFYIPSCQFTTEVKPEFASGAKRIRELSYTWIKFGAVNCEINRETCRSQKIDGYPTFYLFHFGKYAEEFVQGTTADAFVAYAKSPSMASWYRGWF